MRWILGAVLAVVVLGGTWAVVAILNKVVGPDDAVVAMIEKLGGKIERDDKQPDKQVVGVDLAGTKVTDEDLKELKEFKQLRTLYLSGTRVTDAGLIELKEFKPLTLLYLPEVTNATLKTLNEIGLLHALNLGEGEGDKRPRNPMEVCCLNLSFTKVTDEGLKETQSEAGNSRQ